MKLTTYSYANAKAIGVIDGERIIDIGRTVTAFQESLGAPDGLRMEFPLDMLSFLEGGDRYLQLTKEAVEWAKAGNLDDLIVPSADANLLAPITNPSKVIGIGLNYADHCREQNIPLPESVLLFAKFPSSIIGPEESICWDPEVSKEVDYEAELAVIIGRKCFQIDSEHAWDHIAGFTINNDVSARDVQFADRQWVRGKSFDTFCPLGPFLATRDEIGDPGNLYIQTRLNGELVQDSNTAEMVFKIPEIIAFISQSITLLPGDVICTGTPDGVGYFRDPKRLLQPGDVVEIEIQDLGLLRNPVG